MINLKLPKKSREEMKGMEVATEYELPRYPYGLQLRFDEETLTRVKYLQKVGAGDECEFTCKGYIKEVEINDRVDEGGKHKKRECVEIQVTDIEFEKKREDMDAREYAASRRNVLV